MFNKIKIISLAACAAIVLQACHSDDDAHFATVPDAAPQMLNDISASGYAALRGNAQVDALFSSSAEVSGMVDSDLCSVKIHRMVYETIDGVGGSVETSGATTSSGVAMIPYGESVACSGPRPVVLYAHGTNTDLNYDLSQLGTSPANAAAGEAALLLAFYASKGYIVVAPNYAGYTPDSGLSYHPYVNEAQQSTEMIDALNHVKTYAADIGADMSSKLFITGVSQGGYVAMATHKALQNDNVTVTASAPISGPYAVGSFLDLVMSGTVMGGATTFAPMYLTALQKAHNIYIDESEVYEFAGAEGSLPAPGIEDAEAAGLPDDLFSGVAYMTANPNATSLPMGYGTPFLLKESFRTDYLAAMMNPNASSVAAKVRGLAQDADLRDWNPSSPVVMCGADNDPVVFHEANSDLMETYWASLPAGLVTNFDLNVDPDPASDEDLQDKWIANTSEGYNWYVADLTATATGGTAPAAPSDDAILPEDVHSQTGAYCAAVALKTFNSML